MWDVGVGVVGFCCLACLLLVCADLLFVWCGLHVGFGVGFSVVAKFCGYVVVPVCFVL